LLKHPSSSALMEKSVMELKASVSCLRASHIHVLFRHEINLWGIGSRAQCYRIQPKKAVAQTLAARNLEACFNASSASSEHSESEGLEFFPNMELSNTEIAGCSKSSKADSDDNSLAEPQPKKCKTDIEQQFFVSDLHNCWISLSKSTGSALAQHLIAETRFPFLICFHFNLKIEINFVVRLLMVSATI